MSLHTLGLPEMNAHPPHAGIGVSYFEWSTRYVQIRRGDRSGFGERRRRVSVVAATPSRDVERDGTWVWEVIDLRHGGVFRIHRHSFIWFLPVRQLAYADVAEVRAGTPGFGNMLRNPRPELLDELRSLLGADWERSVGMMEMLANQAGAEILGPEDHESHQGIRGVQESGL